MRIYPYKRRKFVDNLWKSAKQGYILDNHLYALAKFEGPTTDFLLRIKFNETFTGLIQTEKGEPNCVYVNASIQKSTDYEVKIPLVGCETIRNREGNYENEIVVQNSDVFDIKNDKRYLLTCIPASPIFRDSQVTVSFGGVTIDTQVTTAVPLINSPKVDYEVSVRDGDDPSAPPLKRPLAVGDRVVSQ
ncbi:unnamed protein product [Strongylus vulgaris]|uniref:ZP domain-containing protein n=1 Tax=Strongylus vulgaris TaxID=40348 RepID=A0A3P7M233_STRVU|nr:unnamed protein product [Strongylus vulgaris]